MLDKLTDAALRVERTLALEKLERIETATDGHTYAPGSYSENSYGIEHGAAEKRLAEIDAEFERRGLSKREHEPDDECWCGPDIEYTDTGRIVIHRRSQ